jgi:hypothetical protein
MPHGKRTAKIAKIYVEARSILHFMKRPCCLKFSGNEDYMPISIPLDSSPCSFIPLREVCR